MSSSRRRGNGKTKAARERRRRTKTRDSGSGQRGVEVEEIDEALTDYLQRVWTERGSGAIAGRGFHYQDAVGAWLALRQLQGELDFDQLVPEGLEDLSCEGPAGWQVQVKSRQAHVGDFPRGIAARHLLDAWSRHREGVARGQPEQLAVVFERPVDGEVSETWGVALGSDECWSELTAEVRRQAGLRGLDESETASLLEGVSVFVLSQREIAATSMSVAATDLDRLTGAMPVVVRALQAAVAQSADANAGLSWEERQGLSRTDINRIVHDAVELIDRNSLDEAIRNGACTPVDFTTPLVSEIFYEGESCQPGHVAAGLVVARPLPTDAVLAGLDARRFVLVAGPSGIGKSAVVWIAAYVARHVQWFRVNRLGDDDVEPLVRLARAYGAGRYGPVGFVVDGVGTGSLAAWDALQIAAAGQPGVLLLGSVRQEDMLPLASLSECVVVHPRLDEELASRIHLELGRRGKAQQPHWLEAFEQSNGLTLEYTHLLTRGRRLEEVVRQQVDDRVRQRRDIELSVLAPVSLAHRLGCSLAIDVLTGELGVAAGELKAALARLVQEHLVSVDGVAISGLHPLRSSAISDAVHSVPPPSLLATAQIVVRSAHVGNLRPFIAGILVDHPDLAGPLLGELVSQTSEPSRLAEALEGLRLADFAATARRWRAIVDGEGVPPPMRPITLQLALLGNNLGELAQVFDPRVVAAMRAIQDDADAASPLRDGLIERLGLEVLKGRLTECTSVAEAVSLLSVLAGSGHDLAVEAASSVADAARRASLDELAELVRAAAGVSSELGDRFLLLAGGASSVKDRMLEADPWLLEVDVTADGGERVLSGTRLHISDRLNPEPAETIKRSAQLGLACLPGVDHAALTTVWPGGLPMQIGGRDVASTRLNTRYVRGAAEIEWNRARSRAALVLVSAESEANRLSTGAEILRRVALFLDELSRSWILNRGSGHRLDQLNRERSELLVEIDKLAPASPDTRDDSFGADAMHSVAKGVVESIAARLSAATNRASLAAFVGDTMRIQLERVAREPWHFIGLREPPPAFATIGRILGDLHAILAELSSSGSTETALIVAARSGSANGALDRAARTARRSANKRHELRLTSLARLAAERGLHVHPVTTVDPKAVATRWPPLRTGLVVDLETLADLEVARRTVTELLPQALPAGGEVLLLPARRGRTLPRFAAAAFVAGRLFARPEPIDAWRDVVPEPWMTPFTDAVVAAHQALQELSGIAYLASQRSPSDDIQAAGEAAARDFRSSVSDIQQLPPDLVTRTALHILNRVAGRVQSELDGNASGTPFAEALFRGVALSENTEEARELGVLLVVAAEWDIDPSGATQLLE